MLLGRAKTHWFVKRGKRRDDYRAEEIYMNAQIYVLGARESICVLQHLQSHSTSGVG